MKIRVCNRSLIISLVFFHFVYSQNTSNNSIVYYSYNTMDQTALYTPMNISTNSTYQSNNTCVTVSDLIQYNNSDKFENWVNFVKITPENFCYGQLSYNISREDFADIVNKNLSRLLLIQMLIETTDSLPLFGDYLMQVV